MEQEAAISAITYAEVRYGQQLMEAKDRRQRAIDLLLNRLPTLPWTQAAANHYASLKARLRQAGRPTGELDTQIAAHALAEELPLVTHNTRHFARIEHLTLEDWVA